MGFTNDTAPIPLPSERQTSAAARTALAGDDSDDPIHIDDTSDDDTPARTACSTASTNTSRHTEGPGRKCGWYNCLAEDVARVASPDLWLSGPGLAVFAEAKWMARTLQEVQHFDSLVFADVRSYVEHRDSVDESGLERVKNSLIQRVAQARIFSVNCVLYIHLCLDTPPERHHSLANCCSRPQATSLDFNRIALGNAVDSFL